MRLNPRVLFQKLGTEAVLLHLDSEEYFGLNEVALRMWEVLTENNFDSELTISELAIEYDTEKMILKNDLSELINNLILNKILVD